jgi:hypothetical protein
MGCIFIFFNSNSLACPPNNPYEKSNCLFYGFSPGMHGFGTGSRYLPLTMETWMHE